MSELVKNKTPLLDRLPNVSGTLEAHASLKAYTWFRTGGEAQVLFTPADEADLADFLKQLAADIPVTVIGLGSNLLVRDGGIKGVVIRLGSGFSKIEVEGEHVRAGAGAPDVKLAHAALKAGLQGLSFYRGIPGTIGGALRMNGGAYGRETSDVFISARAVDSQGKIHELNHDDMGFSYRHTSVPDAWIFTQGLFQGRRGDKETIADEMKEITKAREQSQPVRSRTGGSTFKNPPGAKAWELIDKAGCRGLRLGGAQVSEKHCNFLINEGSATAQDLEELGEMVRKRVLDASGVELEWEIKRLGVDLED